MRDEDLQGENNTDVLQKPHFVGENGYGEYAYCQDCGLWRQDYILWDRSEFIDGDH